jgi:hypothetical protein
MRNKSGSDQESYVSFKAGPNRGHYHGDQLSLHWAAQAKPLMVDHHASYAPRVGQEHMHNRLSFGTKDMPWATMDGHERLLGFATHPAVDVAHAQVQSTRLRRTPKLPPEDWDQRYDIKEIGGTLNYDRSVVFLKSFPHDAILLIDDWSAPKPLHATFNAHVYGSKVVEKGNQIAVDDHFSAIRIAPKSAQLERLDWSHENGGKESTIGLRWTVEAATGTMVTLLWPGENPPEVTVDEDGSLHIGDYHIAHGLGASGQRFIRVSQGGKELVGLEADPNRNQGAIGIFIPDAGYPFGPIPKWLREQRLTRPDWAQNLPKLLDPLEGF